MRIFVFATVLALHMAFGLPSAQGGTLEVGYIPAPSAKSAGRVEVVAQLRQRGKTEARQAQEHATEDCDYFFKAKRLLDSPAIFSLETSMTWTCPGRATQGGIAPLVYEMRSGREYDISLLYRVRDARGALKAPLRKIVASRLDLPRLSMTRAEVEEAVECDLARGRPMLFVGRTGVWAWPENGGVWLDEVMLTWEDLRPYLDVEEARRIGWPINRQAELGSALGRQAGN